MRASYWCRLLGRRPCRRHIAAEDAVALSDTATQPNVRICRESRASPRPSRRRNRLLTRRIEKLATTGAIGQGEP
jgi:hypothetical protein